MPKDFIPRGAFQTEGTRFILENPRCQINVDPGLGKTIMTLNAIETLILCGFTDKILILGPKRVAATVWSDEVKKWSHLSDLRVIPIIGTPKERLKALQVGAQIFTINYELVVWLTEHWGDNWPYRMVVADESTKLKASRASLQTSKLGKKYIVAKGGSRTNALAQITLKTKRWVNLTGSFCPNGLEQVHPQIWFIDAGKRLGRTYTAFSERWFRVGFNGFGLTAMPHAESEIMEAIKDITFTLRAEDYLELPKEIINTVYLDMPACLVLHYSEMEKDLYTEIKNGTIEVEVFTAAAKSTKLHQLVNGGVYYDKEGSFEHLHDTKIDALKEIIEELGGSPALVIYKFKSDLMRLQKAFPEGKKFDQSEKTKKDFQDSKIPILFAHPGSMAHGVDGLQKACNNIIFFSLDWNIEERIQVIARIGAVRQLQAGTGKPVFIHQLVMRNTIDEDILRRVEERISVEESLKLGLARRNLK